MYMIMGIPMNPWSIGGEHVTSTGFNLWTYTQNNKSNQKCENNTRPCTMNTIMPHYWKK